MSPGSGFLFPSPDSKSFKLLFLQVNFLPLFPPFSFWDPYNVNVIMLDGIVEFPNLFSFIIIIFVFCSA